MKKIKTYPNHLEIITSVFIPYKDFDLEDFLDVPTVTIQDIMNAWAPVCIEALKMRMDACVQMLEPYMGRTEPRKSQTREIVSFRCKMRLIKEKDLTN